MSRNRRSESESQHTSPRERRNGLQSPTSPPDDRRPQYSNGRNIDDDYPPSPSDPTSSGSRSYGKAVDRRKSTKSRRVDRTHDLVRLLVAEERDSKEALRVLHRTSQLLDDEKQRNEELERRLAEATDRWKLVNQARIQAQQESSRLQEELRLYKLQLETAQQQITRANDVIVQSDKEKIAAEDAAEKAKGMVRKLQEEKMMRQAKEEGLRQGREEGRREGIRIGLEKGREDAYVEAREEAMQRLDDWIVRQGYPRNGRGQGRFREELEYEDEGIDNGEEEGDEEMYEQQQAPPPPVQRAREMSMQQQQQQAREMSMQQQQQRQPQSGPSTFGPGAQSMPEAQVPRSAPPMRSAMSQPLVDNFPTRSGSQRSFLGRLRNRIGAVGRDPSTDPNVETNLDAPDVGVFVDDHPGRAIATPLSVSATTQLGHMRAASPMVPMPQPNHNPDPRDVPPIMVPPTPRTPSLRHSRVEVPPDGYIPEMEAGVIGIPPPHELSKPVPTPRDGRSPAMGSMSLPGHGQGPPPPPKQPNSRDFYYENPPVAGGSTPRAYPVHGYQTSIPDSVNSEATSQLSILTPPNMAKGAASASRLSAIPESQTPSPYHGDAGRRLSQEQFDARGPSRPLSRASGVSGRGSMRGGYPDELSERRQQIADELKDPEYTSGHGTPRRSETMTPRSGPSAFSFGPRRPTRITTPAPLADNQPYSRPRRDSTNSDHYSDSRSQYGGGPGSVRGHRATMSTPNSGAIPDINIEPPSRTDSRTSQPYGSQRGQNNGYGSDDDSGEPYTPVVPHPMPQSPRMPSSPLPSAPGLPVGFIPTAATPASPLPPSLPGMPTGFVPTGTATPGRGPNSPLPPSMPGMPTGFVPTGMATPGPGLSSPLPPSMPGLPTGFVPMGISTPGPAAASPLPPSMPGLPTGFIPTGVAGSARSDNNISRGLGPQIMPSPRVESFGALPIPPPSGHGHSREGARDSGGWGWGNDNSDSEESGGRSRHGAVMPPPTMSSGPLHSPRPRTTSLSVHGGPTPRPVSPSTRRLSGEFSASPNAPAIPLPPPGFVASGSFAMPSPRMGSGGLARSNSMSMGGGDRRSPSPLPVWAPSGSAPGFVADPLAVPLPMSQFGSRAPSAGFSAGGAASRPISPRPQYAFGAGGGGPENVAFPGSRAPSGNAGSAFGISRAASPRPMFNPSASGGGPVIPAPMPGSPNFGAGGMQRSNSYSLSASRPHTPGAGLARSLSTNVPAGTRSGRTSPQPVMPPHMHFPGGDGMPPSGLHSPFSRRLSVHNMDGGSDPNGPVFPARVPSPAMSNFSNGSRGRVGFAPSGASGGGDTPRSSRVYPRTPHYAPTNLGLGRSGAQDDDAEESSNVGGGFVMMDRPIHSLTDRSNAGNEIKRSASRASVGSARSARSTGSHKKFDSSSYVDAAFLATASADNGPQDGPSSGRRRSGVGTDSGFW